MFLRNLKGLSEAVHVTHTPSGLRFTVTVTLDDPRPRAEFRTWLDAPPQVNRSRDGVWRDLVCGGDCFRYAVEYQPEGSRARFSDVPVIKIQAPMTFKFEFEVLTVHPRIQANAALSKHHRGDHKGVGGFR